MPSSPLPTFSEWLKANPHPDLQALVAKYGAYDLIPEAELTGYIFRCREWARALRNRQFE